MNGTKILSRRRVLAAMHFLLFVFSVTTSTRPCMHTGNATSHGMSAHNMSAHEMSAHEMADMSMPAAPTSETPAPHAPTTPWHSDGCPWVVGCTGVAQLVHDTEWRSVEHVVPTASPVGVTLREITTDRDIESPPPRA